MFGSKTNVYVSISTSYGYVKGEDRQNMKPQHTWMLSVEPHKSPLSGTKESELVHYSASWDSRRNQYQIHPVGATPFGIAGKILITESAHTSPDKIAHLLEEGLQRDGASLPAELEASEGSEHWIRLALHDLQNDKVLPNFDVGEFMTFAHGYVADRHDPESRGTIPATMRYPKLFKQQAKKPKSNGFWISYPSASPNSSSDRVYGGLM